MAKDKEPQALTKIKKGWARNNKFNAYWHGIGKLWKQKGLGENYQNIVDSFPYSVISTQLPDFTDSPMEEYLSEDWMISRGRRETYIISITLRAPSSLKTYEFFSKAFINFEREYPYDQWCKLIFAIEGKGNNIFNIAFEKCLLIGVSGIQLDHSSTEGLIEFSLQFKSAHVTSGAESNSGN